MKFLSTIVFLIAFASFVYTNPGLFPVIDEWFGTAKSGLSTELSPARNLTGKWTGMAPQGATYSDNVANPACSYKANLELELKQEGSTIAGSIGFTVREVKKLLSVPCLAKAGTTFSFPINGKVAGTDISFSHPGIARSFSPTNFKGKFTNDIMSGTFERTPHSGGDLAGLKGEWIVNRSR